jgi:hypothetical protein
MFDTPKTRAEAEKHRYGAWAGRPKGSGFDPECCAYEQYDGRALFHQCRAKPGKGPDDLYCGTHANKIARNEARRQCP